jgi:indolepyruvate ferredoxin oxidoreductase alpha subunit
MACVKKLGCPAIAPGPSEGGAVRACIDPVLCTGCGICKEVCAFAAITGAGPSAAGGES